MQPVRIAWFFAAMLALAGCGPVTETQPSASAGSPLQSVQQGQASDITPEKISRDIVGRKVRITDTNGMNENEWTFEQSEFREIAVVERKTSAKGEQLIVFVTTQNNPAANEDQVRVTGRLQLTYVKKGGQWTLSAIENLNFQYSLGVST